MSGISGQVRSRRPTKGQTWVGTKSGVCVQARQNHVLSGLSRVRIMNGGMIRQNIFRIILTTETHRCQHR